MEVLRAKSAGFCLGVSLALKRLDQELAATRQDDTVSGRLMTFGPIIHNPLVIEGYAAQGVVCVSDTNMIRQGDRVVIRAHGIPREVEAEIKESGAVIIDATCPKVKKAQLAIAKSSLKRGTLLLFGEAEHPEVRGLLSYAEQDSMVFANLRELEALDLNPEDQYFLAAQTTQERTIFHQARDYLQDRLGHAVRIVDTICDATRERQQEVVQLCSKVEAMVVVGGYNSGNTRRLAEVARAAGIPAIHVEQVSDISGKEDASILSEISRIGLTAGASTPQEHIDAMQSFLEERNG